MNDDIFMNRFNNRLSLEPQPSWTRKKRAFPWLELGWAAAAALMLGTYWTELRFAFMMAWAGVSHTAAVVPAPWLYMSLAALAGLVFWAAPRVAREL